MGIPKNISVSIPTIEGFLSRECNNSDCNKYFKVLAETERKEMYCPYCGELQLVNDLHTKEQVKYVKDVAKENITEEVFKEFGKMLSNVARGSKFIEYKHKPYRPKYISKSKIDKQVDSEIKCPECGTVFQVYGIFGYCTSCKYENILIYDANLAIIEQEIKNATSPDRALRHAYNDLVATYELFCRKKAKNYQEEHKSFQELFEPRKFFNKHLGIDIFQGMNNSELLPLRRVFQKRHAYQHYNGVINKQYIKKIPEDKASLDNKAFLSINEFKEAARIMRILLSNLTNAVSS
jgi:uncharacterized Zn-finger protein